MVRAQRYSYILASFFGFAIVLLGTFYKSHRYWLQDCGLLITLAALGIRWAPAVRVMLRLRSMSRSLQRVCSASGVHFGFVNTTYQWLCVFLPTALFLSIICLIADIALRTGHVLLQSGSLVFEIVFVLIVLLFPRVSKVGSLLQRLEAAVYSARRPGSPPKAAKFILLLVPRRHRAPDRRFGRRILNDCASGIRDEESSALVLVARRNHCWSRHVGADKTCGRHGLALEASALGS